MGARLCDFLSRREWRVVGTHRRPSASIQKAGVASEYLPLSSEPERWRRALQSIDCVVHLAALVHQMRPDRDLQASFEHINVEGTRFVAEESARAGVRRFVFLSSAKVNGEGDELRAYRAEDSPAPQDAYARSKLGAEIAVREVCDRTGMEFVIIRSPLVYGPGVRANFERLLSLSGCGAPLPFASVNNRRSMISLENLVDFIETCMRHPLAGGSVWLISDGEDISTPELIRKLAQAMNRPARLFAFPPGLLIAAAKLIGRGEEIARLCGSFTVDSNPAREVLHWRAPISVAQGLERTAAAHQIRRKS
jgi:nucleoside-diphosphate-sugar epimerase